MTVTQLTLSIHKIKPDGTISNTPEVLVGKLPVGILLRQPTIVDEPKTWMIHHNEDYTHYSLYAKNIVVAQGKEGNISFNLILPVNRKLDGCTVLDVLNAVEEMWVSNANKISTENSKVGKEDFEKYLSQLSLVERELFFPVMKGENPAAHCIANKNQLGALLNFSRFPILTTVAYLELGHDCDTTINLPIPQKQRTQPVPPPSLDIEEETTEEETPQIQDKVVSENYEIWLNGALLKTMKLLPQTPIVPSEFEDTDGERYDAINVTLQDLLDSENHVVQFDDATVVLDLEDKIIDLLANPINLAYSLDLKWEGDSAGIIEVKQKLEMGKEAKLLIDGKDLYNQDHQPSLTIAPDLLSIQPVIIGAFNGYSVTAKLESDASNKKATITIRVEKEKQVAAPPPFPGKSMIATPPPLPEKSTSAPPLSDTITPPPFQGPITPPLYEAPAVNQEATELSEPSIYDLYTDSQINPGLFSLTGRYRRSKYWGVQLAVVLGSVVLSFVFAYVLGDWGGSIFIFAILQLLLGWISLAATVKRLHDLGHSALGWIIVMPLISVILGLMNLLPLIGLIGIAFSIYLYFFKGEEQDNSFGPSPY